MSDSHSPSGITPTPIRRYTFHRTSSDDEFTKRRAAFRDDLERSLTAVTCSDDSNFRPSSPKVCIQLGDLPEKDGSGESPLSQSQESPGKVKGRSSHKKNKSLDISRIHRRFVGSASERKYRTVETKSREQQKSPISPNVERVQARSRSYSNPMRFLSPKSRNRASSPELEILDSVHLEEQSDFGNLSDKKRHRARRVVSKLAGRTQRSPSPSTSTEGSPVGSVEVIDPPSPVSDILFLRAFEQHIVGCGEGNYDELELDLTEAQQLFAKQTLRVKQKKTSKSIMGMFGFQNEEEDRETEDSFDKSAWAQLDVAKKKRRMYEFLEKRPSLRNMLTNHILNTIPSSGDHLIAQENYQEDPTNPILISIPCKGWEIEKGSAESTMEQKLKYCKVVDPDEEPPYYSLHFYKKPHFNFFGDGGPKIGPIIVSIQDQGVGEEKNRAHSRVLVRTKKGQVCDFVVVAGRKEMFAEVKQKYPEIFGSAKLKLCKEPWFEDKLQHMEERQRSKGHKIGVMLCLPGQTTDDEMLSNVDSTDEFDEFLDCIGERVMLQGFKGFSGGLDVKTNTTGTQSFYTELGGREIMFHVSTLLPFHKDDTQRVERKRHIGNDIVVVVFQEEPCKFQPNNFVSEFVNVMACVSVDEAATAQYGTKHYRVSFAIRDGVLPFAPFLHDPPVYSKDIFREFFLTKLLNGEQAAMQAPVFAQKLMRTTKETLQEVMKGLPM